MMGRMTPAGRVHQFFLAALVVLGFFMGPAVAQDRSRIAVLELKGKLTRGQLSVMSDKVRAGVLRALSGKNYVVMSRENMAVLLKDMGLDCESVQGECEVETGRNIGAAYVVSGSVEDVGGGLWLCTLKVHDTRSGALLATDDVRGKQVIEIIDQLPPTVAQLTSRAFGVELVGGQGQIVDQGQIPGGRFGSVGNLGVQAKLKEQECARVAEERGNRARSSRMVDAVNRAQSEARRAWQQRSSELQMCTKLKRDQRTSCISAVRQWLSVARSMSVDLPAGEETVQTDCGSRVRAYSSEHRQVAATDLASAEALLVRLEAPDASVGGQGIYGQVGPEPIPNSDATSSKRREIQEEWESCRQGKAAKCTDLGYSYQMGLGVRQDYARSLSLYSLGCDNGNATGCSNLGFMYDKGLGLGKNPKMAIQLYEQGCDQGSALGCSNLGTMYQTANGVSKSLSRARELYKKGCDGDNALACRNLGRLYDKGDGVSQDHRHAAGLYTKACNGGDGGGCTNLGILYENGTGVSRSYTTALSMYKKSCEKSRPLGCFYAGINLMEGLGVPKDTRTGRAYLVKACRLGNKDACGKL